MMTFFCWIVLIRGSCQQLKHLGKPSTLQSWPCDNSQTQHLVTSQMPAEYSHHFTEKARGKKPPSTWTKTHRALNFTPATTPTLLPVLPRRGTFHRHFPTSWLCVSRLEFTVNISKLSRMAYLQFAPSWTGFSMEVRADYLDVPLEVCI